MKKLKPFHDDDDESDDDPVQEPEGRSPCREGTTLVLIIKGGTRQSAPLVEAVQAT